MSIMKQTKTKQFFNFLFAGLILLVIAAGLQACSKKSNASKTANSEAGVPNPNAPADLKESMQIKRDAAGNYVVVLTLKDLEAVKLMKPAKEGYIVWMVNETNATTNIGNIEGANKWKAKKDFVNFEATSAVKPVKIFITAETDLKAEKPGTQIVWTTKNF